MDFRSESGPNHDKIGSESGLRQRVRRGSGAEGWVWLGGLCSSAESLDTRGACPMARPCWDFHVDPDVHLCQEAVAILPRLVPHILGQLCFALRHCC